MLLQEPIMKSPLGYSGDQSPTPGTIPFPKTGGPQPPLKTFIADCGQTVPGTTVVCIDNL